MVVGRIFSGGTTVVKFHFTNSETKRKTFFYNNVNSKMSNFKSQGARPPFWRPSSLANVLIYSMWFIVTGNGVYRFRRLVDKNKMTDSPVNVSSGERIFMNTSKPFEVKCHGVFTKIVFEKSENWQQLFSLTSFNTFKAYAEQSFS